jgi:hypothetical protein
MPNLAASKGLKITIQDAATTGNGTHLGIPSSIKHHIFYVRGAAGVTAGAITFETASDPDYTGDWAPLVNHLATPTSNPLTVVAEDEEIYVYEGTLAAVRARISTTISGGASPSVTVNYLGS